MKGGHANVFMKDGPLLTLIKSLRQRGQRRIFCMLGQGFLGCVIWDKGAEADITFLNQVPV